MKDYDYKEMIVVSNHETKPGSGIFSLRLRWYDKFHNDMRDALPGHFVFLESLHPSTIESKPFSISCVNKNQITLIIKSVGPNTRLYALLKAGDKIKVSGLKGNPIPVSKKKTNYILVAGGIGIAPIRNYAKRLFSEGKKVMLCMGAKDEKQLLPRSYFGIFDVTVKSITDDRGFATDLLREVLKDDDESSVVVACGPDGMLIKFAEIMAGKKNESYVVLEEFMGCGGTGACGGCAVACTDIPFRLVCQKGPAFKTNLIDWEAKKIKIEVIDFPLITPEDNPLEARLNGLILKTPIMNASGCYVLGSANVDHAGAIVLKSTKLKDTPGNPASRVYGLTGGLQNSIGLAGDGIDKITENKLPNYQGLNTKIFYSIAGNTTEEYVELAKKVPNQGVAGVEVNISCPNVKEGGMAFGANAKSASNVISKIRKERPDLFISGKLTPIAMSNIDEIAIAVEEAGADAVVLVNTFPSRFIDIDTRRFTLGMEYGGYSGPAIFPIALELVHKVASSKLKIPVIAVGGIKNPNYATQMILAGATAIQIGTGLFGNPNLISDICKFWLDDYFPQNNINHYSVMIGAGR